MKRRRFLRIVALAGSAVATTLTPACMMVQDDVVELRLTATCNSSALDLLLQAKCKVKIDERALSDTDPTKATYVVAINDNHEDSPSGRNKPPGRCWSFALINEMDEEVGLTDPIDQYHVQKGQVLVARLSVVPLPA